MKNVGTKGFTQSRKNHLNYIFGGNGTIGSREGNGFIGLEGLSGPVDIFESLPTMSWSVPVSSSHFSIPAVLGIAVTRAHEGTCSPVTVLHFAQHKSSGPSGEWSQRKSHAGSSVSIDSSICLSDSAAKMAS